MARAPYPELTFHGPGTNHLPFKWAELVTPHGGSYNSSHSNSGCSASTEIIIEYQDLELAIGSLVGYSQVIRDKGTGDAIRLSRNLPWQHPKWLGLWCTRITSATGYQALGKTQALQGPVALDSYVKLGLEFTRPPYPILSDADVARVVRQDGTNYYPEWNRFTDRLWTPSVEMISRQQGSLMFIEGSKRGGRFMGAIGYPISKVGLQRRWYQIPESGIYNSSGLPVPMIKDPVTGQTCMSTVNKGIYLNGGGFQSTFLGCDQGQLLYLQSEIIPQPLPIPGYLMNLGFGETYPLQYDIVFRFMYFDPPRGSTSTFQGHNCFPYARDANWYAGTTLNASVVVTSSTDANPIVVTTAAPHGYTTDDLVNVAGHATNTNANGTWVIEVTGASTFKLNGSAGNGAGAGAGGTVIGGTPPLRFYDFTKLWQVI